MEGIHAEGEDADDFIEMTPELHAEIKEIIGGFAQFDPSVLPFLKYADQKKDEEKEDSESDEDEEDSDEEEEESEEEEDSDDEILKEELLGREKGPFYIANPQRVCTLASEAARKRFEQLPEAQREAQIQKCLTDLEKYTVIQEGKLEELQKKWSSETSRKSKKTKKRCQESEENSDDVDSDNESWMTKEELKEWWNDMDKVWDETFADKYKLKRKANYSENGLELDENPSRIGGHQTLLPPIRESIRMESERRFVRLPELKESKPILFDNPYIRPINHQPRGQSSMIQEMKLNNAIMVADPSYDWRNSNSMDIEPRKTDSTSSDNSSQRSIEIHRFFESPRPGTPINPETPPKMKRNLTVSMTHEDDIFIMNPIQEQMNLALQSTPVYIHHQDSRPNTSFNPKTPPKRIEKPLIELAEKEETGMEPIQKEMMKLRKSVRLAHPPTPIVKHAPKSLPTRQFLSRAPPLKSIRKSQKLIKNRGIPLKAAKSAVITVENTERRKGPIRAARCRKVQYYGTISEESEEEWHVEHVQKKRGRPRKVVPLVSTAKSVHNPPESTSKLEIIARKTVQEVPKNHRTTRSAMKRAIPEEN